ncbi:MAG: serine/threonine-protein kinase [Verrucomicrobiales bacterium]|nr:serine/threonine-protein kinase [Verrucomicrobiales bacterium]
MKTEPKPARRECSLCGSPLLQHEQEGFCSRCLAHTSLMEDASEPEPDAVFDQVLSTKSSRAPDRLRLGDFEVLEELARGGMGVVFKARQTSLDRVVALKMLLFGGWGGSEAAQRFRTEATAAAALDHPNIVRVFHVGDHDGQPFLAMQYIAGRNLAEAVRERSMPARDAAQCVALIARAIQFAHGHGVLHRDLKPSNILLDAKGVPHVTDFGLAKLLTSETELTATGQSLGSPNYAPPEQAGNSAAVSVRSDVYGLGAILYHALTGRPPFQGHSPADVLVQVRELDPIPPRQLDPSIPVDLETICLKCLEKEPAKRYATAQELADELDRFLRDEPIHARPVARTERGWRWCRRKPALAGSIALVGVLFLVLGVGGPLAALRIDRERQRAEGEALRARRNEYASDMLLAQQALEKNNRGRVRELLEKHGPAGKSEARNPKSEIRESRSLSTLSSQPSTDLRGWEWRYLWNQTTSDELFTLASESNVISVAAWSQDGERIATASAIRGTNSARVKIWNLAERRESENFDVPGHVSELRFVSRDELLVIGFRDLAIHVWNSTTGRAVEIPTGEEIGAVTLSTDGHTAGGHRQDLGGALEFGDPATDHSREPPRDPDSE